MSLNNDSNKNKMSDSSFDIGNDPFEEFEFKPLTEGLGFHRKKESTKIEFTNPELQFISSTPSNFNNTQGLSTPLPRTKTGSSEIKTNSNEILKPRIQIPMIEDDSISKAQTAVNEILKNLNHKKQQEEAQLKNKKRMTWRNTSPSLMAGILDAMLVMASFLVMLIAMLAITKVDLIANISSPGVGQMTWLATLALLGSVTLIYMVVCRAYMGYTPGEWAFDQRCGTETQQATATYILKVVLRCTIVMCTGFLPLMILSKLFNFDIVGMISRLQIQTQKYV